MKVKIEGVTDAGVPLCEVPCGTVVRTMRGGETIYLVANLMDATGVRILVTLGGGTVKRPAQDFRVVPLDATVTVHGMSAFPLPTRFEAPGTEHAKFKVNTPCSYVAGCWVDGDGNHSMAFTCTPR